MTTLLNKFDFIEILSTSTVREPGILFIIVGALVGSTIGIAILMLASIIKVNHKSKRQKAIEIMTTLTLMLSCTSMLLNFNTYKNKPIENKDSLAYKLLFNDKEVVVVKSEMEIDSVSEITKYYDIVNMGDGVYELTEKVGVSQT